MNHLCISKYDIKYRNELGVYLRDDWTSISDVGKVCEGELVTMEEYERVEKNYLDALWDIIQTIGVSHFQIEGLRPWVDKDLLDFPLVNGTIINREQCIALAKQILREKIWGHMTSEKLSIYFSYDYYVHISFEGDLDAVKAIIKKYNLFWETEDRGWFDEEEDEEDDE